MYVLGETEEKKVIRGCYIVKRSNEQGFKVDYRGVFADRCVLVIFWRRKRNLDRTSQNWLNWTSLCVTDQQTVNSAILSRLADLCDVFDWKQPRRHR